MFDDAAITGEIESNNLLDKLNIWTGHGMTEINPIMAVSNGLDPNSTPEQLIYIYITDGIEMIRMWLFERI